VVLEALGVCAIANPPRHNSRHRDAKMRKFFI
jgi:hypothetical protein